MLEHYPTSRVPGEAIFMTMNSGNVPPALLHNLKHNKVLHDHVVFLTILAADVPCISPEERFVVNKLSASSSTATVDYGFNEDPDLPEALRLVAKANPELDLEPMRTSYFLSRQAVVAARKPALWRGRRAVFSFMARNYTRSNKFFKIPANRAVEMRMLVRL